METVITLEEFHQLVLFHLIDINLPHYTNWISIDNTGEAYAWADEPEHDTVEEPPIEAWAEKDGKITSGSWIHTTKGNQLVVPIPKHLSWKDCYWKI